MASDPKKAKITCSQGDILHVPLQNFLNWCNEVQLTISNKVHVSNEGTVAEYGMLASEDIDEGEVLFSIPRNVLLHPETSKVKRVLEENKELLESTSGWVPLILTLMHEYTCPQSFWTPYLSLWPDFKALDHPMFWPREERDELLKGTGIREAVERDLANIEKEYTDIALPFMRKHLDVWDPAQHNLDLYKCMVAFIMAYSFQEPLDDDEEEQDMCPNPPMMVPMADMLNHVSKHNANLEYTPDCLKMVTTCKIQAGGEVFNTYGHLANWQLLHMYGFVEPHEENNHDTVDIQMSSVHKAALQLTETEEERQLVELKWSNLLDMETVGEKEVFIFGRNGCHTDMELHTTLRILCMDKHEFEGLQEEEFQDPDWEEAEDEEEVARAMSNDGLPELPIAWRRLLYVAAGITLDTYAETIEADQKVLKDQKALAKLDSRCRRVLQVRFGQKRILKQLQELTKT